MVIGDPADGTERKPQLLQPKLAKAQSLLSFMRLDRLPMNGLTK
jgi:hypothetical protein